MLRNLSSPRLYRILLISNLIVSTAVFFYFLNSPGKPDYKTYVGLAKSLLHGDYSFWNGLLEGYVPDTLRPPGYPLFIALFVWLPQYYHIVQFVQFGLYLLSVWMCISIFTGFDRSLKSTNLFLLLLLPNIQIPFYASQLLPEPTVGVALVGLAWIYFKERKSTGLYVLTGFLWLYIFECRPVFLFFPFLFIAWMWFLRRRNTAWKMWFVSLLVFIVGVLPYGWWNYKNHGVFSITPLEGGGSILMAGYWQYKLPGVMMNVSTGFTFDDELISNHDWEKVKSDSVTFATDCNEIIAQIKPYMSSRDLRDDDTMYYYLKTIPLWPTYSGRYTVIKEKMFREKAKEYIKNDWWYWLKTRPFNIARCFVTNVMIENWNAPGIGNKIKGIYPCISTFILMILFLSCFIYNVFKKFPKHLLTKQSLILVYALCFYYWFIYFPFAAQSRYSIPIHLLAVATISITLATNTSFFSGVKGQDANISDGNTHT